MPKLKLMDNQDVIALLNRERAKAEAAAHRSLKRQYSGMLRSLRETVVASGLEPKTRKSLLASLTENLSAYAPSQVAEAE